MSKLFLIILALAALLGYYFYRTNRFTDISASFDYTTEEIFVTAIQNDLHDCKLKLTNDFSVDIPFLRRAERLGINKDDFQQWNGTRLDTIQGLGPEIEFNLRCQEGVAEKKESNRYSNLQEPPKERKDEEEIDSR